MYRLNPVDNAFSWQQGRWEPLRTEHEFIAVLRGAGQDDATAPAGAGGLPRHRQASGLRDPFSLEQARHCAAPGRRYLLSASFAQFQQALAYWGAPSSIAAMPM